MSQLEFLYTQELIVDNFAGGGGASLGIEQAFGRSVDIAINHDQEAVEMHKVNHPDTQHYCEDVWKVDPVKAVDGRPVGFAWFSPDCKHFSKAKGTKPVSKKIRGLAWIVIKWAKKVRPRVIMLENVEEFETWGPLTFAKNTDGTYKLDRDDNPAMVPCPERKGQTFDRWKNELVRLGYKVEWRMLRACDYGAPTTRRRLFLIARCDGLPIVWPEPTHGDPETKAVKKGKLLPWRTAAECIDWDTQVRSIFGRKKSLAENTLKRIARGLQRFVINAADPFIVRLGHTGWSGDGMQYQVDKPLTTITSKAEHCLVLPHIQRQFGQGVGHSVDSPAATVTAGGGGKSALVSAFLAKHYGGNYNGAGIEMRKPTDTVTTQDHHALVTSHMIHLRGTCKDGKDIRQPVPTITAGGTHVGEVRAFLMKYYGTGGQWQDCRDPLHTIPTKARYGLVTVAGEDYQIVDIGMRMLEPRELYRAQGFPDSYQINITGPNGKPLTKAAQVRMCGNSVSPHMSKALVEANVAKQSQVVAA